MGFQDRDYYRDSSQSTYVTSMVMKLIIINGLVFLAEVLAGWGPSGQNTVSSLLGVHPNTIVQPLYWWQFLTAGFVHDEGLNHILFNMIGLYCFGMPLEERYGRVELLRFYLVAIVLGNIVWATTHFFYFTQSLSAEQAADAIRLVTCFGASGGVTAVTLLFCLLYPRATLLAAFLFPVPAWLVGAFIIVSNLFGASGSSALPGGIAYDVHLVGAGLAIGYWYFGWNFGRLPGMDGIRKLLRSGQRWVAAKPPLKVHDPEHYYEDLDAEADRLLDKVARDGLASLTAQERRVLEDYSRRTRQKLR
jgi:membrane associated rhomboid family serine protease